MLININIIISIIVYMKLNVNFEEIFKNTP
jgi:hypothetical protein